MLDHLCTTRLGALSYCKHRELLPRVGRSLLLDLSAPETLSFRFDERSKFLLRTSRVTPQVPNMGDSITEGTVVAFLKQPGEYAELDEVVVQIETDKVTRNLRFVLLAERNNDDL